MAAIAAASIGVVRAQAPYLAKGNQEINAFGGLSYGLQNWKGSYGANYAVAPFNKYVMLYGEYSYFPGVTRSFGPVNQGGITVSPGGNSALKFNDLHGGVHIRLPIFSEKRIVPYLAGGLGMLHDSGDVNLPVFTGVGTNTRTVKFPVSGTAFAFNGGGGMRLYLSGDGRFGLRLEGKVYRPTSDITVVVDPASNTSATSKASAFGKISFGIFYQFR